MVACCLRIWSGSVPDHITSIPDPDELFEVAEVLDYRIVGDLKNSFLCVGRVMGPKIALLWWVLLIC